MYIEHFFSFVGISDSLLNIPSRIGLHVMCFWERNPQELCRMHLGKLILFTLALNDFEI